MTSCVKNLKRPSSKAQALAYLAKDLGVTILPGPQTKARVEQKQAPTEWQRYVSQASAQLKAQGRSGSDFTEVNRLAHQLAAENGWVKGAKAPKSRPSDAAEAAARKLRGKTARQALATARATDTVLKKANIDYIGRPATSKDSRRAPAKRKKAARGASSWNDAVRAATAEWKAAGGTGKLPLAEINRRAHEIRGTVPGASSKKPRAAPKKPRASFYEAPAPTYFDLGAGPPRPATARQAKRGRGAASLGSSVGSLGRVEKMGRLGSVFTDDEVAELLGLD